LAEVPLESSPVAVSMNFGIKRNEFNKLKGKKLIHKCIKYNKTTKRTYSTVTNSDGGGVKA